MSELQIVIINTVAHILLFVFCFLKYKLVNLSTILSALYAMSSVASYLLYVFPLYSLTYTSQGVVTLPAITYQFIVNPLIILAFSKCSLNKCEILTKYNNDYIFKIQKFLNIVLTIYIIFSLPNSIRNFFSGGNLADMRNELYGTNTSGAPFFISLIGRTFGSTPIILLSIVCVKLFLFNKFEKIDKYSIFVYALLKLNIIFSMISRSIIAFSFMELISAFILFYNLINKNIRRKVIKYGLIVSIGVYGIFSVITTARFGGNSMTETLSTLRYTGESQLNFATLEWNDLKEPFYGWTQFSLFRRILGLPYDDGLSREGEAVFNTYIQKEYHYYNPTYIFHGFVGDWCFNWGFITTFILAVLFNFVLRKSYRNERKLSFILICVTIILSGYVGKGIFYLDYQSESGNLLIVYLILLWLILKKYGHSFKTKLYK